MRVHYSYQTNRKMESLVSNLEDGRTGDKVTGVQTNWIGFGLANCVTLTFVTSWQPGVLVEHLLILLPTATKLQHAVLSIRHVQDGETLGCAIVLEHLNVVVASLTLVVELGQAEEVRVAVAGGGAQVSWGVNNLED